MGEILTSGTIVSEDFQQHSEALAPAWQVAFNQLSKGAFHAELQYLQTNHCLLYTEQWNQRLQVAGESPEGYLMLGATASADFVWDGSTLSQHELVIKRSKEDLDFTISGDHTVILVPYEKLDTILGEERAQGLLSKRHTVSCNDAINAEFNRTVHCLLSRFHRPTTAHDKATLAEHVDFEIGRLLNNVAGQQLGERHQSDQTLRRASLVKALKITRNLRQPLAIPELARRVGVSQRTLNSAFQESFSVPPTTYLRRVRLNQVRRELQRSSTESTTITEIGSNWGFTELGRMAVEYRTMFGESPSETLATLPNRAAHRLPSRPSSQALQSQHRQ